jgi:arachidonate 15-lipoxygenase (second type)/8-lipoxygenase (S-type)
VDLMFPYSGASAKAYTTNRYQNGGAGRFQGNYFNTNLKNRGLINSAYGPALKNFPFYEDGSVVYNAIHTFVASFVSSYYASDAAVVADKELQYWVSECNGGAQVIDFPSQISTTAALIDVLTHIVSLHLSIRSSGNGKALRYFSIRTLAKLFVFY